MLYFHMLECMSRWAPEVRVLDSKTLATLPDDGNGWGASLGRGTGWGLGGGWGEGLGRGSGWGEAAGDTGGLL